MTQPRYPAVALAALLALAPTLARADAGEPVKREGVWAQDYSDRPADPDVRFGRLANGMRYAIQHNATPPGRSSLRLRIGSGSLDERDDQRGLAHFLEHMAFRGSARVPAGEMVRMLQRLGLSFGADTNAHTGFDQTVYQFDLPHSDKDTFAAGMLLLREIASELTLVQTEMDPERGVVLSEERLRDTPGYRRTVAELGFQLEGQLAAERMPIGLTSILRDAPVSLIRDFYETWYRPDNATIVVVGDIDVAAVEADIRARFSDWRPAAASKVAMPKVATRGEVLRRGPTARILAAPGTPESVSVAWVGAYDATADISARERRDLAELLAISVLGRRMDVAAQEADAPFLGASAGRSNLLRSARLTVFDMQPKPGRWQESLRAAVAMQRQLARFGAAPEEIARAMTEIRTEMRNAADAAPTRGSSRIADAIVRAANDDEVYTNPRQDRTEIETMLAAIGPAEMQAAITRLFAAEGPLVLVSGATEVPGGADAVALALRQSLAEEVRAGAAEASLAWPYAPAEVPGAIAAQTTSRTSTSPKCASPTACDCC